MKAISLWQPWAQFVVSGVKTIETRTHNRFKSLVGQRILIHASAKWDNYWYLKAKIYIHKGGVIIPPKIVDGGILGSTYVSESRLLDNTDSFNALCDCNGLYGLILRDAASFNKVIPYKGQQGIFNVPLMNL